MVPKEVCFLLQLYHIQFLVIFVFLAILICSPLHFNFPVILNTTDKLDRNRLSFYLLHYDCLDPCHIPTFPFRDCLPCPCYYWHHLPPFQSGCFCHRDLVAAFPLLIPPSVALSGGSVPWHSGPLACHF